MHHSQLSGENLENPLMNTLSITPEFDLENDDLEPLTEDEVERLIACTDACDTSTPSDVLARLAYHASAEVRSLVASNPSTAPLQLQHLSEDENVTVRLVLARSTNLPLGVMRSLAFDHTPVVRSVLARNENLPASYRVTLTKDRHEAVRNAAREFTERVSLALAC